MKCPIDATDLVMSERSGVEIDYCPQCRGIWLDRGELDKILDRAATEYGRGPAVPQAPVDDRGRFSDHGRDRDRGHDSGHGRDRDYDSRSGKKRRREGFLGELFDF